MPLQNAKKEWKCFKSDAPGERFLNHHRRARQDRSKWRGVLRIGSGVVLTLGGLAMLVLPGPGVLVAVFGLGLLAGEFRWLSTLLDNAEMWVRKVVARLKGTKPPSNSNTDA